MKYIINGDEVTHSIFDRDMTDNDNCGIKYNLDVSDTEMVMTYED